MTAAAFDPDVARALALMRAAHRPPFETLSVAAARAVYRAGRDTVQLPPVAMAMVGDLTLAGRPARRYRPSPGGADGTILFFHGGGYVIGDLDTHDTICRHLARAAGMELIAIDYRLAPEHRFPSAFDDCLAAYAEIARGDVRIALAGDSAGGALAAAVAIGAAQADLPRPAALALFYPVADLGAEAPSYAAVTDVPIGAATMRWFWRHYLPQEGAGAGANADIGAAGAAGAAAAAAAAAEDWRASPLRGAVAACPPSFVTTAGHDPLHDEGHALVAALRAAGVPVVHRDLPGQIHGYLTLGRLIGEAERSLVAAGAFLRTQLTA